MSQQMQLVKKQPKRAMLKLNGKLGSASGRIRKITLKSWQEGQRVLLHTKICGSYTVSPEHCVGSISNPRIQSRAKMELWRSS